jgi:hypothetical protein
MDNKMSEKLDELLAKRDELRAHVAELDAEIETLDEDLTLECELCGETENDDKWIEFGAGNARSFNVVICTKCASQEKRLYEAFEIFAKELPDALTKDVPTLRRIK